MNTNNLFDLSGKTVLISGGASYLGSAISEGLAAFGANLFILGKNERKNANKARELKTKYDLKICESMPFDIQNQQLIEEVVHAIQQTTGSIDVLINNAAYGCLKSLEDYSESEWEKGIDGTINGVFRVTQKVLPYMVNQHYGSIINTASMYGMVAPDMRIYGNSGQNNPANYGAGKAAVIQFTKYLAAVYGKYGIRANAVSPGPFPNNETQKNEQFIGQLSGKNPLGRIGQPEDLQGIYIYLASDASLYTTGQNIAVDGGWTAW